MKELAQQFELVAQAFDKEAEAATNRARAFEGLTPTEDNPVPSLDGLADGYNALVMESLAKAFRNASRQLTKQ